LEEQVEELKACKERGRRTQREFEQVQAECESLICAGADRDSRVNAAQSLLESRIYSLQSQLSGTKTEYDEARQHADRRATEVSSMTSRNEELRKEEQKCVTQEAAAFEALTRHENALYAEVAQLRVEAKAAQAEALAAVDDRSSRRADVEQVLVAARAQADQLADEVRSATERASSAERQLSASEAELETLRTEATAESAKLCADAEHAAAEAVQHKQLIRVMQQSFGEQEKKSAQELEMRDELHQRALEELQQALAEARRMHAAPHADTSSADHRKKPLIDSSNSCKNSNDVDLESMHATSAAGRVSAAPEDAGREEVHALYTQMALLEKRCSTLQKKLNARPIVFSATGGDNPLHLESAGGSASTGCGGGRGASLKALRLCIERPLRIFTQRLLRHDAWLLIFYTHLLVLYAIAASWFATVTPGGQDNVDINLRQGLHRSD